MTTIAGVELACACMAPCFCRQECNVGLHAETVSLHCHTLSKFTRRGDEGYRLQSGLERAMSEDDEQPEFLTESEVAKMLRVSTSAIKRRRLSGKLAYIPGRPLLISRADLAAYLATIRVPAAASSSEFEDVTSPPPVATIDAELEVRQNARAWALRRKLRAPRARRRTTGAT